MHYLHNFKFIPRSKGSVAYSKQYRGELWGKVEPATTKEDLGRDCRRDKVSSRLTLPLIVTLHRGKILSWDFVV